MSLFNETTTYVELTKHTLIAAQTKDARIQIVRECSLLEKTSVEEIFNLLQTDWKVVGLNAVTALSPQPAYWHRSNAAEASHHRTEEALRSLGESLPHTLTGPLEIIACHSADGTLITPDGHARWLLGFASESSLALANANAAEIRVESSRTLSATLGRIGVIASALRFADRGWAIVWDLSPDRSHLFLVNPRGVQAVVPCSVGLEDIFTALQTSLKLNFRAAATRIFYDSTYDFSDAAPKIAAYVAPALKEAFGRLPATDSPPQLFCTGVTGKQAWFVRETAHTLGLQPWTPKISALCAQLKLDFASHDIEASVTPASLGLLHLIARGQQNKTG